MRDREYAASRGRNPEWFDEDHYFAVKLAAMKITDPAYTAGQLSAAFSAAGFIGERGLFEHFTVYGHWEDLSPNALFDPEQYYTAKTAQFYGRQSVTENEVQTVTQLIHEAGMSAWSHYTAYGAAEGVNPSNSFHAEAYLAAKLAHMRLTDPAATMRGLHDALDANDLTPLGHFLLYGKDEGFIRDANELKVPDPVAVTPSPIDPPAPVDPPATLPTIELSGFHYGIARAEFPAGTDAGHAVLNGFTTHSGLYASNVANLTLHLRGANTIREDDTPFDDAIFGTNLSTVRITGDPGASLTVEGIAAHTVDASALNGSLRISLSDRHATTLIGSQGNDFIETEGMADMIAGGSGNDVFRIGGETDGHFSSWTLARTATITDFSRGDVLDFSEASRFFQGFASTGQVTAGTEQELINIIRDYLAGPERGILVAHHGGNTYLAANGDAWDVDDDLVVRLSGTHDQAGLSISGSQVTVA